jgi:hypothetical protein
MDERRTNFCFSSIQAGSKHAWLLSVFFFRFIPFLRDILSSSMAVYDHNYLYMYFQLGPSYIRWMFSRLTREIVEDKIDALLVHGHRFCGLSNFTHCSLDQGPPRLQSLHLFVLTLLAA